jgi:hypothetical protein
MKNAIVTPKPMATLPRVVSGRSIAQTTRWDARGRARGAAMWLAGLISVTPTAKLAAQTFGVSMPLVVAAVADLEAELNGAKSNSRGHIGNGNDGHLNGGNGGYHYANGSTSEEPVDDDDDELPLAGDVDDLWDLMEPADRAAFVARNLPAVWKAVEAVT